MPSHATMLFTGGAGSDSIAAVSEAGGSTLARDDMNESRRPRRIRRMRALCVCYCCIFPATLPMLALLPALASPKACRQSGLAQASKSAMVVPVTRVLGVHTLGMDA